MAQKIGFALNSSLLLFILLLKVADPRVKAVASAEPSTPETERTQAASDLPPKDVPAKTCAFSAKPRVTDPAPIFLVEMRVENTAIALQVMGSTVLTREEILSFEPIQKILQSVEQQVLSREQFQSAYQNLVAGITQLYVSKGYLTSQALSADSLTLEEKTADIPVSEGRLEQIQVPETGRFHLSYLCDRIALGVGVPFNVIALEGQLRLLNRNPLIQNVTANLKASGKPGLSILEVKVEEAKPLTFSVGADNYSPPSLGGERWNVGFNVGNVTGWGDRLSASFYRSTTGGANILDASYQLPLNSQEGTLQLRAVPNWTKITQSPLDQLDITGNNQIYEINYRQPLIRTLEEEFALSIGFRYAQGRTLGLNRLIELGSSRTSVVQFSQDYLHRDTKGVWLARSLFNLGTGLFNPTTNSGFLPDGYFFSWLGQAQRLQQLGKDHLLIIQAELQLTPDPLTPDYLFIIGGGQSIRGYRQNARSGDNGFRLSIEDRITLLRDGAGTSRFQIAPFIDLGKVWNAANNPTTLPSQTFLIGAGLGLIWEPSNNLRLRLDYGYPLVNLQDRGNNIQDDGLYFEVRTNYSLGL